MLVFILYDHSFSVNLSCLLSFVWFVVFFYDHVLHESRW